MVNDPINRVLALRGQKERMQQSHVVEAKLKQEVCEEQFRRQRSALDEFRAWRRQREEALFRGLQETIASPREVMAYLASCELLKQDEASLLQDLAKAEKALSAARSDVARARDAMHAATRAKEKFELLIHERDTAVALEQRLASENELDETTMTQTVFSRRT